MKGDITLICDGVLPFDFSDLLKSIPKKLGQTAEISVDLSFVGEDEIRRLNAEYRNIDKVTDVLSFPYLDGIKGKILKADDFSDELDDEGRILIGSVCICLERAKEQAEEYRHSLLRETTYLLLHGILHCFGFDHIEKADEEEMTSLAEEIMSEINIKR